MRINRLPAGFVIPAQPVKASKPPVGTDWVHEIKHDGYPKLALFNEHIAQDGPVVFEHACRLGAEGIVSKRVDSTYQSGPCRVWIKVRNPASIAVQRERSEIWNRRTSGSAWR
jgi:ATP-dependent DNA ligase